MTAEEILSRLPEPLKKAVEHPARWRTLVVAGVDDNGTPCMWLLANSGEVELLGLADSVIPDNVKVALAQAQVQRAQQMRTGLIKPV